MLEFAVLIEAGRSWGTLNTLALIVFTGVLGAALARAEGLRVLGAIQEDMAQGRMPAPRLVDGLMILVAGVLLVTPGFLTDGAGFLLLLPPVRTAVRKVLLKVFQRRMQQGKTMDVTYWEWK